MHHIGSATLTIDTERKKRELERASSYMLTPPSSNRFISLVNVRQLLALLAPAAGG
jgi:hypothetical protein